MNNLKAKLKKQGGFTLVEMLIVVAIIAILIAISIPLVNGALERARDATDQANERAAKAEAMLYYMGAVSDDELAAIGCTPGEGFTAYYDAKDGKLVKNNGGTSASTIIPYGQCTRQSDCYEDTNPLTASVNNTIHVGKAIIVDVDDDGTVAILWAQV